MKHILVAVAGSAPQIVTETMWALAQESDKAISFDDIHVVTTETARNRAEQLSDAITSLCRELKFPVPNLHIHVYEDAEGRPLRDIRSASDSAAFGRGIADLVRRITMNTETVLYASIAGGRKTMGYLLGQAMSLFARQSDRLTHVLVDPEFEQCDDFWYPTKRSRDLIGLAGQELDSSAATVELTDIAFPRLRGRLSSADLRNAVIAPDPLMERAQRSVDSSNAKSSLTFELLSVMPENLMSSASRARVLKPVLASLPANASLTLRILTTDGPRARVRILLECEVRDTCEEQVTATLHDLASSIQHSFEAARSGMKLKMCTDLPPRRELEWERAILADSIELAQDKSETKLLSSWAQQLPGVLAAPPVLDTFADLPLAALASRSIHTELHWRIQPVALDSEGKSAANRAAQELAGCIDAAANDVHIIDASSSQVHLKDGSLLSRDAAKELLRQLEQWASDGMGYRTSVRIASAQPLAPAMLEEFGRAVWGGRAFRAGDIDTSHQIKPNVDLASAFPRIAAHPFKFPSIKALEAGGIAPLFPMAPMGVATDGIALGKSGERTVNLNADDRSQHLYVIGGTGTGKSTLLRNLIAQDIEAGSGVFVMDPHGDLIDQLIQRIPTSRQDDVVLLDTSDFEYPISLNFLATERGNPQLSVGFVVNELLAMLQRLYSNNPEGFGPMFEQYFRVAMNVLLESEREVPPTLLDFVRFFTDRRFRGSVTRTCTNRDTVAILKTLLESGGEASWENITPYIVSKLNRFTMNPLLRNITCRSDSNTNFRELMDGGKLIFVKLPRGAISELDVRLLGMLLIGRLFTAALSREDTPLNERRPLNVYIDEFQNFATASIGQMMSEARKYGLRLTLANQSLWQLDPALRQTVLGNAANLLAFRTGPEDAGTLAPFFKHGGNPLDLQALPNYHCAARIMFEGTPVLPPFVMETEETSPGSEDVAESEALIELARQLYAKPREEVERLLALKPTASADE